MFFVKFDVFHRVKESLEIKSWLRSRNYRKTRKIACKRNMQKMRWHMKFIFRWRRYDTAPGAAVSAIPGVREIDGPTDTFRIDVSPTLLFLTYPVMHVYCLYLW